MQALGHPHRRKNAGNFWSGDENPLNLAPSRSDPSRLFQPGYVVALFFLQAFLWVSAVIEEALSGFVPVVILACIPMVMSASFPLTPSTVIVASAALNIFCSPVLCFVTVIVPAFVSMAVTFPPNAFSVLFPFAKAMPGRAARRIRANVYDIRLFILNILLIWFLGLERMGSGANDQSQAKKVTDP